MSATGESFNPDGVRSRDVQVAGAPPDQSADDGGRGQSTLQDADIPASIARDAEIAAAYVPQGEPLVDTTTLDALTFSNPPTQAECEALRDEVSALLATLRVHA